MNYLEKLSKGYDIDTWRRLLNDIFGTNFEAYISPSKIEVDTHLAKQSRQLGIIKLSDVAK